MINCHDLENWYKKIILSFCLFTGGYQNFNVDPNTGWITIKTELDRDDATIQDSGGVYAMYVKVKQIMQAYSLKYMYYDLVSKRLYPYN